MIKQIKQWNKKQVILNANALKRHKTRIMDILRLYLEDNQKTHIMRADGSYRKTVNHEHPISAQEELMREAKEADTERMTVIERLQPIYKS